MGSVMISVMFVVVMILSLIGGVRNGRVQCGIDDGRSRLFRRHFGRFRQQDNIGLSFAGHNWNDNFICNNYS
jgi:hypothetical protein